MKKISKLFLLLLMITLSIGSKCSAKTNYAKFEKKYHISQCLLRAMDEEIPDFKVTNASCKKLEQSFEEYEDLYLVLMVYELGVEKGSRLYDQGQYTQLALSICEKSEKYERQLEKKQSKKYIGTYTITAYCSCSRCCGKSDGITASGTHVKDGRTIACGSLPIGTKVYIDGVGERTVEDRGVHGKWIDLYMDSHSECLRFGLKKRKVYIRRTNGNE